MTEKHCSKCGQLKPETLEFFGFIKRYNHFNNVCRECIRVRDEECRRAKGIKPKNKPLDDGTKGCAKCGQLLPLSKFYLLQSGKHSVYCIDCKKEDSKRYYYRDLEINREKNRLSAIKNKDKASIRRKHKYLEYRKATDVWITKHRDRVNASIRKRRSLKENLPYNLPAGKEFEIISRFDGRCAICGRSESADRVIVLDHWIAVKSGVTNNPGTVEANLIPICHGKTGCNNSKKNHLPLEWLKSKFGAEGQIIYDKIERYLAEVNNGNYPHNI